jgi:starvation-inducible DNA-binding protein
MSTQITDVLNKQVANWNVLFVKLHNYHWYVQGPHFFTLHVKFEEFYNEAALHIDELAERMLALGVKPLAKMSDYLQQASVKEASGNENAEQMVEAIIADFSILIAESKEGMALAQEANDETTGDMLLAIYSELEKHVWMLKAFIA